ncbi:uncharacterized protein LOC116020532 [Ipomoea triloba]|uniref:uncharacterized protein LOC116020532 n=1 Tax=Ipomoea triloba TaxID=35885 RepID=UPI00125D522B|nr:uncharacterized protein LOC116020532 [Ipomoea triloba]
MEIRRAFASSSRQGNPGDIRNKMDSLEKTDRFSVAINPREIELRALVQTDCKEMEKALNDTNESNHQLGASPESLLQRVNSQKMAFSLKNFMGEDQSFFFEVVTDLFSEDTGVSRPADSLFHAAMEEYTDVLAIRLLVAIRRSPEKIRRFRCCTLLRRLVEGKWSHIHLSFQERCKELLFQLLRREQEWDILKGLCACVSIIASSQQCEWPELVDIMFEWLSPKEKSVAGILFSQIIPIPKWWDTFRPAAGNLGLAFYSMLKEASADNRTKTAIAGAAAKLMLHFHTPNHLELLAAVISVFGGPDVVYDEDLALSALDALNILGREKVELFTPRIMSSLANEWFPPEMNNEYMRHLIVKLLITVGEGGDQHREMIRNFPSYAIEELFTQLLHVIWVEDDISWDVHEMGAGKMPMSSSADHSLRRLAMVLGQDLVVSCLANLLPNYFNDNDWKKRYTGVISLGLIAPSLIPSKTHATIAMSSFCQNGCSDIFKPYLDKMQRGLCVLLETPGKTIEAALSGLASLAESAKDDFRPFGDTVIDKLNNLRSKEVSNRMLVAKILHCITVVELAVGKSVVHVEKTFMALQAQLVGVDTDDEVKCVLLQGGLPATRHYCEEDLVGH